MEPYIIRVLQCSIGQYNLLSNEKSLSFVMGIYTKNNGVYTEDGVKALLSYSGEPDELEDFQQAEGNLYEVFNKCIKYANRVTSTTDYLSQTLLFYKIYKSHFDILEQNTKAARDKKLLKEIEYLTNQMNLSVLSDVDDLTCRIEQCIIKEKDSLDYWSKKQLDYVEGSDSYESTQVTINQYQTKIDKLQSYLN